LTCNTSRSERRSGGADASEACIVTKPGGEAEQIYKRVGTKLFSDEETTMYFDDKAYC
jgi:hypothetical protein